MSGPRAAGRPKLAVAVTFPIDPPRGGGQVRIFELYRELAHVYDVELVTLGRPGTAASRREIAPRVWETRVPKSDEHAKREGRLQAEAGALVGDVATMSLYGCTPAYLEALRDAARGARAVIASHPYTLPAIHEVADAPLWYEAHNVEADLKAHVLVGSACAEALLRETERTERACCEEAELIWACSDEDRADLIRRYAPRPEKVEVVPNGVALEDLEYVSIPARRAHKRRLGMAERCLAVFIGSWHAPNVEALRTLLELAPSQPAVDFMCLGTVGMALADAELPDNVDLAGPFAPEFRRAVLSVADLALNPVVTGSGTNLKMLDYFASGTPVVSTEFGARGLGVAPGRHYLGAEETGFGQAVQAARSVDDHALEAIAAAARASVEANFSWRAIASRLLASLPAG